MVAFELSTDEGILCTAGLTETGDGPLTLTITNAWSRGREGNFEGFKVVLHGMQPSSHGAQQVTWRTGHRMVVGDELRVRVVEVAQVDPPTEVKPGQRAADVHPHCAFCGATREEAKGMAYGCEAAICPACIERLAAMGRRTRGT